MKVTWKSNYDRDNAQLTYQVLRNGVVVHTQTGLSADWFRPTLSWTDIGRSGGTSYTYQVRATDPFGNAVTGSSASIKATGAANKTAPDQTIAPDAPTVAPDATVTPDVAPVPDVAPAPEVQPVPAAPEVQPDPEVKPIPGTKPLPDDAPAPIPEVPAA